MPVATGYDFLDWVRSLSPANGGQVPVLALTALATQSDCQQALQAGFNAYLSKPCEPDDLLAVVTQLWRTAHPVGQTDDTLSCPDPNEPVPSDSRAWVDGGKR